MSRRTVLGWQTSLADLSMVLFLIVAAAAGKHSGHPAKAGSPPGLAHSQGAVAGSVDAQPVAPLAVYIAAPDAPPLGQWLAAQAADPRQQLTITAVYGPKQGAQHKALADAERLLAQAKGHGRWARVVIEPGEGPPHVALAYDASAPSLARALHKP